MTSTNDEASLTQSRQAADRQAILTAAALSLSLPVDVMMYLLLPVYADEFGVTLVQAGILLAANRLIRIVCYGSVARYYARHGDRPTCSLAVGVAALCALGQATLSGFWLLLPLRLAWGLCFAALNLATEASAVAEMSGAARRSGRSRAVISLGSTILLPIGAWSAMHWGPRPIFFVLAACSLAALAVTRLLPGRLSAPRSLRRGLQKPNSLDVWSFLDGLVIDGLLVFGLTFLGNALMPGSGVIVAALLLATRYLGEILLSPLGGRWASRLGAEALMWHLSWMTGIALIGFGFGLLWSATAMIVVLRSLKLPLIAPMVAHRTTPADRLQALATRSVWRDIGAGVGPVLAGVLVPVAPSNWLYGVSALALTASAWACTRPRRP